MSTEQPQYVSSWKRATTFQTDAAAVSVAQLRATADVMRAIADVDLAPLRGAMTTDSLGNPITDTQEQTTAWSTATEAEDVSDRAREWARVLQAAADRRELAAKEEGGGGED
ncbi:hypothetical protein [Microbacterium aurantiacum]|uniref:hypothetical protein n=1 Tax=Microbacterium aurantiacum TaxID=162393 RepID=UPI003F4969FF